jgi:NAD(P)-dependent dehydrogenase (short-subunit alcohol dehydrogenase family)
MVVGAGSIGPGWGNGKATAVTFAREGAQVFCVDRNGAARGDRRNHHVEGGKATRSPPTSRAPPRSRRWWRLPEAYGRIDVLDNNVGIAEMGRRGRGARSEWDRVFAVNLKSAFLAMKHVIP